MYLRYESKKADLMVFGKNQYTLRYYSISYREDGTRVDTLRFIQRFPTWKEAIEKACEMIQDLKEVKENIIHFEGEFKL